MSASNPYTCLKSTQIFNGMKGKEIETLLRCFAGSVREYQPCERIELEGGRQNEIGIILEGVVEFRKADIWGNEPLIARIQSGNLFGEMLVDGSLDRTLISFLAASSCKVLVFPFQRAIRTCGIACEFHYKFVENLMLMIARKNTRITEQMEITSKKTLRERILTYLSQQIQKQGGSQFTSTMGRLELAEYLCVDRCALTRELTRMKEEGILDYEKNTFCLLNQKAS